MPHVIDLIETSASGTGRMRFEPSGDERSAAQIWQDSERVAQWLIGRVGTGQRIGAFLTNTPDCPAFVFGVWRSGNTLVSLPYPGRGADAVTYVGQIQQMCDLAGVRVLTVDDAYRDLLPPMPLPVASFGEAAREQTGPVAELVPGGDLIQFTSGSLGRPKGVLLSGEALAANILSIMEATDAQPGDRGVTWLPLSHDMGFVGMFLTCFASMAPAIGGELMVLQTPESFLADPASWLRLCSAHRATVTTAPNFAFELACRAAPFLRGIDLSSLRVCITGAERVRADTLRRFSSAFAGAGLRPEVICPAYGMAEAALAVTMVRPDRPWRELSLDRQSLGEGRIQPSLPSTGSSVAASGDAVTYVSNGPVVPGLEVRIAPARRQETDGLHAPQESAGHDAGAGQDGGVGEVQIRGNSLFSDYLGASRELTADGWFPTRDIGFLEGGELFLVGRSDETIIVGGQNHYPGDIEHAVGHDLVRPGCLAAVPLEAGYALLAEPVGQPEQPVIERACRELASQAVRRAGLRPSMVGFLPRGALLKTPSGKVQRVSMGTALAAGQLTMLGSVWLDTTDRRQPVRSDHA